MSNRADDLYGKGLSALGSSGGLSSVPWPAAGHRVDHKDYDPELVNSAIRNHQAPEEIDPRGLRASQPHLRTDIVDHYMHSDEVFANKDHAGNETPIVYEREPLPGMPSWKGPERIILSGHHRAAASLLSGHQFKAILVHGGYGPAR